MEIAHLSSIEDPAIQADQAVEAMRSAEEYICKARAVRDEAIFKLSLAGRKPFDIAQQLELSKSQVISVIRTAKLRRQSGVDQANAS